MTRSAFTRCTLCFIVAVATMAGCSSTPTVDTSPGAEASFDGLIPLKGTNMRKAWVREGFDLTGYTKIMIKGAGVQYRPIKGRAGSTTMERSNQKEFAISDRGKEMVEKVIYEEFDKALDKLTRYEEVTEPGPDVLMVRGAILDVVSRVPPETAGAVDYYLNSVGQATFMVELIDSESGSVLVRAVDARAMQTVGYTTISNRVTNAAEVRRLMGAWARMLVEALNDLTSLDALTSGN